jgi:hypothetical protein
MGDRAFAFVRTPGPKGFPWHTGREQEDLILFPGSLRAERMLRPFELNVVIEMELVRVRAQPDGVDLLVAFVIQPRFDHVLGEDVAA